MTTVHIPAPVVPFYSLLAGTRFVFAWQAKWNTAALYVKINDHLYARVPETDLNELHMTVPDPTVPTVVRV